MANKELFLNSYEANVSALASHKHRLPTLIPWSNNCPICMMHITLYRGVSKSFTRPLTTYENIGSETVIVCIFNLHSNVNT